MRKLPDRSAPFAAGCIVFFLLPFAGGLYFVWQWCLAALLLAALLVWQALASGRLRCPCSPLTWLCLAVMAAGAGWNLAFGIDRSAAWDGLLRLAACGLFGLWLLQWDPARRRQLLDLLPRMGTLMVLLCLAAGLHPDLRPFVYENSRMAGPFQYANTFSMFLLAGLAVHRTPAGLRRFAVDALLLFGIVASGSRSALLLTAGWLVWLLFRRRPGPRFWLPLAVVAGVALLLAFAADGWIFARFFRPGAFSTLWGRLLYLKDGLRLLAGHPLGVGYLGWFYLQRMIQTGVYNVRFVHNDLLQLALDFGLPAAAAAALWVVCRLRRGCCAPGLAVLLCLHGMADPDQSFLVMAFLLLAALSPAWEEASARNLPGRLAVLLAAAALVVFLPRGAADGAYRLGDLSLARTLAPGDTELATEEMLASADLEEAAAEARRILQNNPYQAIAWQILAEDAMSRRDFDTMATAQRQAVLLLKYDQSLYDEALRRLQYALQNGWAADRAADQMGWLLQQMDDTLAATDPLAWRLRDQPELAFPEQVRLMIHILEQTT